MKTVSKLVFSFFTGILFSATAQADSICLKLIKGSGAVFYRNGTIATTNAGQKGASWLYENGTLMTSNALAEGGAILYKDGKLLSTDAGRPGSAWFWNNGALRSTDFGKKGATWFYDNGQIEMTDGPELSLEDLWQEACKMALDS